MSYVNYRLGDIKHQKSRSALDDLPLYPEMRSPDESFNMGSIHIPTFSEKLNGRYALCSFVKIAAKM